MPAKTTRQPEQARRGRRQARGIGPEGEAEEEQHDRGEEERADRRRWRPRSSARRVLAGDGQGDRAPRAERRSSGGSHRRSARRRQRRGGVLADARPRSTDAPVRARASTRPSRSGARRSVLWEATRTLTPTSRHAPSSCSTRPMPSASSAAYGSSSRTSDALPSRIRPSASRLRMPAEKSRDPIAGAARRAPRRPGRARRARRRSGVPSMVAAKSQVLARRQVVVQPGGVRQVRDALPDQVPRRGRRRARRRGRRAVRGPYRGGQQPQQGRLARAVRPEQRNGAPASMRSETPASAGLPAKRRARSVGGDRRRTRCRVPRGSGARRRSWSAACSTRGAKRGPPHYAVPLGGRQMLAGA